jgi:ABC-type branched-subunit amino acid transport system ATPase component
MSLVLSLCEWIYVIDFGRPLMAGTPADVRASHEVRGAYLGRSAA